MKHLKKLTLLHSNDMHGDFMAKETALRTMDEYVDFYTSKINDK